MPRNGTTGIYTPVSNSASPAVPFTAIVSADFNALIDDITTALNTMEPELLTSLIEAMAAALPTTLPATSGKLWLNGGVLSIS